MALLSGERRTADVTALDYSRFAMLSRADFLRFLRQHPEIQSEIAATAAQRAASTRQLMLELSQKE
jgi:CPA2 family monovalent cation:H+ antiporter-2